MKRLFEKRKVVNGRKEKNAGRGFSRIRMLAAVSMVIIQSLISTAPACALGSSEHERTTQSALALMATTATVQALAAQSTIGDSTSAAEGNPNQYSASHYDNCCWDEGKNWILNHRQAAVTAAYNYYKGSGDFLTVCKNLGYVIHATQDFYAHSNWIENNAWGQIADLEGSKPSYWISGYYKSSTPNNVSPGTPSHGQMNKDSSSRPGYYEANGDAILATQDQMSRFQNAIWVGYPSEAGAIIAKLGFRSTPTPYIDATINWPNDKIYFFIGSQYYRYDLRLGDCVDAGYPKPIYGNWPGLQPFSNRVDAVFVRPDGKKAYFFSGSQYIRYDIATDKADAGYPLPIYGNWSGLESFASGIDAAFLLPGTNKVYFFKGNQYIRYDLVADTADTGYPAPIFGNWKGLEAFGSVDAAFSYVDLFNQTKIYFFKGDQYVRYDLAGDRVDSAYPLPISGNWDTIRYPY